MAVSISPETSIASLNDFAKPITEVISGSTKFVNGLTTDKPARTVESVDIDHLFPKKQHVGIMVTINHALHNPCESMSIDEALERLRTPEPIAFIDIRSRHHYVANHPVFAVNAPIDSLETHCDTLFGSESATALVIGDDELLTTWASHLITQKTNLQPKVIRGGFSAWEAAGLPTWGGEYTPSKAFGEWVEQTGSMSHISPLEAMKSPVHDQFDVRPLEEFNRFTLPGSRHCPTGRLGALKTQQTHLRVHCAGRTRGIIAAQTLVDLDFPATIQCISGGTQGWEIAGGTRQFNHPTEQVDLIPSSEENSRAQVLIKKYHLPIFTATEEVAWLNESRDFRLLTVCEDQLDTPSISPTTLIQSTDQYLGTHHIPVIVEGPHALDVSVTVLWLRRMGWDARIRETNATASQTTHEISAQQSAFVKIEDHCTVIDTRPSRSFSRSRVQNSSWVPRSLFRELLPTVTYVVICETDATKRQTAILLAWLGIEQATCIGWQEVSPDLIDHSHIQHRTHPVDQPLFFPNRHHGNLEDAKGYLHWEHSLLPTLTQHGQIPWAPITQTPTQPQSHLTEFYQGVHR